MFTLRSLPSARRRFFPLPSLVSAMSSAPVGSPVDDTVGPTYRYQRSLPNLPVPSIDDTARKYLRSIQPLVSRQAPGTPTASDAHPTPEYTATKRAVEEFIYSPIVKDLQARLEKRAFNEGRDNWLSDWWNETAYMGYREPLVPHVSYFYNHQDDKMRRTGPSRAAALVRALLYFRRMTENQQLEPEMVKGKPLCMASYKYLFNSCRYPVKPSDKARKFDPDTHNHIVVIRKGRFYEVSVVREDGEWLSAAEFEQQFNKIIEQADAQGWTPHPVGALTSEHRDVWTEARAHMVLDSLNVKSLERIESAIIIVALDDNRPVTKEELSWNIWVGDGKNRFFDKHQLIVSDNGKSGFSGEHSCLDGTPTCRLNEWLLRSIAAGKIDLAEATRPTSTTFTTLIQPPKPIYFNLSTSSQQSIASAQKAHQNLMKPHQLCVLQYAGYGKRVIKKYKISPDSWAQLVIQLAYYKMEHKLVATYESAQTRQFKLGRTEVIRSATIEALKWCKAMEDIDARHEIKFNLFKNAVDAHGEYAKWAANAQGVDRHLFGLRKMLRTGEALPSLYKDPSYSLSSHWILSTSHLASEMFIGWGYGEVVPDGFGLSYSVNNDSITFTITTLTGKAEKLRHYLAEAATEMRSLVATALATKPTTAHLGQEGTEEILPLSSSSSSRMASQAKL